MERKKEKFLIKLDKVIDAVREEQKITDSYAFIPEIIEILEFMKKRIDANNDEKNKIIGGIGRIVTDSFTFSESKIGGRILDIINDFSQT